MKTRYAIMLLVALLLLVACGSQSQPRATSTTTSAIDRIGSAKTHDACFGHLRHRDRDFCLTDLNDEAFVSRSNDSFVRKFREQTIMADSRGVNDIHLYE